MKIVKLQGGLGNQMFQYAFGRGLAAKTGDAVAFDLSGLDPLPGVTERTFALDAFRTAVPAAPSNEVRRFDGARHSPRLANLKRILGTPVPRYIRERDHVFHPELWDISGDAYFDGYWQSENYFSHIADEIRSAFTPRRPLGKMAEEIARMIGPESISLHVRRGDYVTNEKVARTIGACDASYYARALARAIAGLSDPHVFVFSDDVAWVLESIHFPCPTTIVSGHRLEDWEELSLMSRCSRHVISNSSFSWWGAWLGAGHDTMTIAPAHWFNDPALAHTDITPSSWTRI